MLLVTGVWNPLKQDFDPAAPTLAGFLLARIAEDEAAVHDLANHGGATGVPGRCREHRRADGWEWIPTDQWDDSYRLATTSDRVLAECEAKRRIVELHKPDAWSCSVCVDEETFSEDSAGGREYFRSAKLYPCETLMRDLAAVYASHPDYREEWRP